MSSWRNPFTPTFGVSPPLLVGRQPLLEQFAESLDEGPGSPGRATVYTGGRGTGKTVMLNEVEDLARRRGWLVISETATAGFSGRMVGEHLPVLLRELDPKARKARLTGLSAPMGMGGATWSSEPERQGEPGLRSLLTRVLELLDPQGSGLLITLDEIQRQPAEELRQLAATVQHLFREEAQIAFAGAGLPSALSSVLHDEVITFLRRADRHVLGPVPLPEVAEALAEPVRKQGREILDADADRAADATAGYPFMIQLVGYHIWRQSPAQAQIGAGDVDGGVVAARRRLGALVHEPTVSALSEVDRTFLLAMAQDERPSRMRDIAARMGCDANYASQYRLRLIEAGVIESAGHGRVRFATPYLREYLRDHGALDAQREGQ